VKAPAAVLAIMYCLKLKALFLPIDAGMIVKAPSAACLQV
jgi:hypothetical protein